VQVVVVAINITALLLVAALLLDLLLFATMVMSPQMV
jgi:hypothetical protein